MRIHSDVLSPSAIYTAAHVVSGQAPDIYVDSCSIHGSRKRRYGFEVALRGNGERHTRRPNSGRYGATSDNSYAATYDDWGYWLAELYRQDPAMIAAHYGSETSFHNQTKWNYYANA